MFYIVEKVIAIAFTEFYKYIRRRTQIREDKTASLTPNTRVIDEPKAAEEESEHVVAESIQESIKEPKVIKEESESENENVESVKNHGAEREFSVSENIGVVECSNILWSKLVAQADSPKSNSQIPKTASSKITTKSTESKKLKRRRFRKFVPKPSPQEILNKKILARRRWIFRKYTFKV